MLPSNKSEKTSAGRREKGNIAEQSILSPAWVVQNSKEVSPMQLDIIASIREGVKKQEWKEFIHSIDATEKEFEFLLPSSISSMQKRTIYNKETSERIYELAKLFGLGFEVFDSNEDFKKWLQLPSKTLGGQKPFDLLDSSLGFQLVEQEITRIQYNVYG